MKKIIIASSIIYLCLLLFHSCIHDAQEEFNSGPYIFDPQNTKLMWTAYKYSSKLGVSGILSEIVFNPVIQSFKDQKDIHAIFSDFAFESDLNFNDEETNTVRNQNIQNFFFDQLKSKKISGIVISKNGSETEGNVSIELIFNGVKKIVPAKYTIINNTIELSCSLHLQDFDAMDALSTLHDHVSDLHKGPDGISITWPDVDIKVVSILRVKP